MRFKIDLASLIAGRKFTVFALFTLYLRLISKYKPPGGLYLEGLFNGGFFALRVWGAYIWRGLFSEFYGIYTTACCSPFLIGFDLHNHLADLIQDIRHLCSHFMIYGIKATSGGIPGGNK